MQEEITFRHSEPEDHEAVYRVYSGPRAMARTLGLPFSSKEPWRERLAGKREGEFSLVACVGGEVVGHLSVYLYPEPRRRHSGHFGMAVRDDWQGKGVGTKLLEAALDLADNWLGLTRLDLRVFVDNGAALALYQKFGASAAGSEALRKCLEGAQKTLLLNKLLQPMVEPPILAAPAGSECFVVSARGPAVQGEVLSRAIGALEQFRAEVAVATAEQMCPLPGGAIGTLELALLTHPRLEPPEQDVHGHLPQQGRQAVRIYLEPRNATSAYTSSRTSSISQARLAASCHSI
jgi:putative acetyltransferase